MKYGPWLLIFALLLTGADAALPRTGNRVLSKPLSQERGSFRQLGESRGSVPSELEERDESRKDGFLPACPFRLESESSWRAPSARGLISFSRFQIAFRASRAPPV